MSCVAACLFHADLVDPLLLRLVGTMERDRDLALASLFQRNDRLDTRATWPDFRINLCDVTRELLNTTPGLLNRETHKNQWAIINGPAIAAIHSVYDIPVSSGQIRDFKRLRSLDSEWFDAANLYAMHHLANRRIQEDSEWIQEIVRQSIPNPTHASA